MFTKNVSQLVTKKPKTFMKRKRNVNPFKSFYKFPIIKLLQINQQIKRPSSSIAYIEIFY